MADVVDVSAGETHTLALNADGTVWAWGGNNVGQLGEPPSSGRTTPGQVVGLSDIIAVKAGRYFSMALAKDGSIWNWGSNSNYALGDGTSMDRHTPGKIPTLSGIVKIAAGPQHAMALKDDGTVWFWGRNDFGELQDGSNSSYWLNRKNPEQIPGILSAVDIAAGEEHRLILESTGLVWAIGKHGALGDATQRTRSEVVRVADLTDVIAIAAGDEHSMALSEGPLVVHPVGGEQLHASSIAARTARASRV